MYADIPYHYEGFQLGFIFVHFNDFGRDIWSALFRLLDSKKQFSQEQLHSDVQQHKSDGTSMSFLFFFSLFFFFVLIFVFFFSK